MHFREPHGISDSLPRISTLLCTRQRIQVEAATEGRLKLLHRSTIHENYEDLKAGHADGLLISAAVVRDADLPTLLSLTRDLPGALVVGMVGEDGQVAAAGTLLLGRAGITQLVDVRDRNGWTILRDSFALEVPERPVCDALAAVISGIEVEADGTRTRCTEGCRRFFVTIFSPSATTGLAVAAQFGVVPSTLMSRFDRAGLPSPKQYMALAKLVRAAYLGEVAGLPIRAIAERLHASSPQSFGRTVRHMTGMTAAEFKRTVSGATMLDRFINSLVAPYREILRTFDPIHPNPHALRASQAGRAA
jgi:AraC-like DNA-binding protein